MTMSSPAVLPSLTLRTLPRLTNLNLNYNHLRDVPKCVRECAALRELHVGVNYLRDMFVDDRLMRGLTSATFGQQMVDYTYGNSENHKFPSLETLAALAALDLL